ncbi:hypothetical protein IFM61606_03675 [Aspergillus udagawae]|uniref:Uncharacterized protein n=1 Tax=Aspergillus udagawae TaxID=91492 RepID=A0A8H3RY52_9EURO|nr:hypothetical protein IFM46972_04842 [Aspergillus udagawae]GFG23785.1 hypothetical protein IFM61606_03675 [Aspergillus udagawae]
MSGLRETLKEGWHPKGKSGGKESWRGDFKGINQVAGWMGKGKDRDSEQEQHVSRPLSSLKDPSAFGPPPKHIAAHGPGAVPNQTTPDRRGLGAPLSQEQTQHVQARQQEQNRAEEAEPQRPAGPPLPYRANTTGLNTDKLPPPPARRMHSPASSVSSASSRPVPSVPPRIPPRMNPTPQSHPATPPPAYSPSEPASEGLLNRGAVSHLSNAGVSVPALGIGHDRSSPSNTTAGVAGQASVDELQARFSQMRTSSSQSPSQAPSPPVRGSTTQPESSATSTVNNLRERHNDKLQAGKERVQNLNDKYKITQRFNNFVDEKRSANTSISSKQFRPPPTTPHPNRSEPSSDSVEIDTLNRRKAPPPPPPPKKAAMRSTPVNGSSPSSPAPPPLPLSTKPV